MYLETIDRFSELAEKKARLVNDNPISFFIGAMMAGTYVGMGILLIFSLGGQVDTSVRPIVMGVSFGIALTLVVFAGSELFTGLIMTMAFGWLRNKVGLGDVFYALGFCWLGTYRQFVRCWWWRCIIRCQCRFTKRSGEFQNEPFSHRAVLPCNSL